MAFAAGPACEIRQNQAGSEVTTESNPIMSGQPQSGLIWNRSGRGF